MKLYELTEKYNSLLSLLDEDGVDKESLKGQINLIEDQFIFKAENIGKAILSLDADAEAVKVEITRLAVRQKSLERKSEWLKDYILTEMLSSGQKEIKGAIVSLTIRTNPASVNILDLNLIPNEYRRIIPETWQPDKKMILDRAKSTGEIIPGVVIVTDKKSLSVR